MANTNHQKVDFPVASLVFFFERGKSVPPVSCNYVGRDVEDFEGFFV